MGLITVPGRSSAGSALKKEAADWPRLKLHALTNSILRIRKRGGKITPLMNDNSPISQKHHFRRTFPTERNSPVRSVNAAPRRSPGYRLELRPLYSCSRVFLRDRSA